MATTMPGVTRDAKRGIVRSAARGAGLIGAAVILGIILLQVVDDGTGGPAGNGGNGDTPTVTTGANGTTDPTAPTNTRPPAEVRVLVLNASGVPQAAGNLSNALRGAGYNMLPASDDPVQRQGTLVACREGFENDANALLLAVTAQAVPQAEVGPFPTDPPPPGAEEANCLVVIGQG